jgi:hypothetical protein
MHLKRTVVFGTRHLESRRPVFTGQLPAHEEVFRGQRLLTYSTGRLEQALSLGLTVYVVSIRPAFGPHDEWWRQQLPSENVLNSSDIFASANAAQALSSAFRPWRELFRRLGVKWPDEGFKDLDDPSQYLVKVYGSIDPLCLTGNPEAN